MSFLILKRFQTNSQENSHIIGRKYLKNIFTSCRKLQGNHKTRASINENEQCHNTNRRKQLLNIWLQKKTQIVDNAYKNVFG